MKIIFMKFFDRMLAYTFFFVQKKAPLTAAPKRVLVIKLSAMGDAACLMPAVRQLYCAFDNIQIDWFTTRRTVPHLFLGASFIRHVYVLPTSLFNFLSFFFKNFFSLAKYDLIIDFDQYYRISELISFLGKSNAGFSTPLKGKKFALSISYDPIRNEKLIFSDLVNLIVVRHKGRDTRYTPLLPELLSGFIPSSRLLDFADQISKSNKPVLIIYPGSSPNAIYRRWSISSYIELIGLLNQSYEIIVAGGPDELSLKYKIAKAGYESYDYIGSWSLHEWLWIFQNIRGLFVGNDAGLLHLAESQGMPVLGIFGPNINSKWGSINPVSAAAEIQLECRPCIKSYLGRVPNYCARGDTKCLADISTQSVAHVIRNKFPSSSFIS